MPNYVHIFLQSYLACGVSGNDIMLFSLMQKACYKSLMLALHKFRVTKEYKRCSVDDTELLVLFALSSGMISSPADFLGRESSTAAPRINETTSKHWSASTTRGSSQSRRCCRATPRAPWRTLCPVTTSTNHAT